VTYGLAMADDSDATTSDDDDNVKPPRRGLSSLGFVGKTIAATLIVLATLWVVFVIFAFAVIIPRNNAEQEWNKCAKPHIDAGNYWLRNGDLKKSQAEIAAVEAECGEAP
jgi:hypothetical protein